MPPSSLTPVKKGGYTAVLYLMNDLQFRMRGREPISLIIGQARPLAMCSPILHYQKGNVRNQAWRKYPIPCLVHLQGPTAINVHDLDRRAAPVNLWKFLISIVIDNLPLSHSETLANALDVFLEEVTKIRMIGQLFAIADVSVHPGAAPDEVIENMKLPAKKLRIFVQTTDDMPRRLSEPWAKLDCLAVPPIESADILVVLTFLFRNHAWLCNRIGYSCLLRPWRRILHETCPEGRPFCRSSAINDPARKPDLTNAIFK